MSEKPPLPITLHSLLCERCGYDRVMHHHANLADGPFVGKYMLICPIAVFKAKGHDIDGTPLKGTRK